MAAAAAVADALGADPIVAPALADTAQASMAAIAVALPAGFESLAPFVAHWARDTTDARLAARCEASMADIQAFYDTMLPPAESAIANHAWRSAHAGVSQWIKSQARGQAR